MANDPLKPGTTSGPDNDDGTDGGDLTAFRIGSMTSQSDIDKAKIRYGSAFGSNYRAEETGWDGLTKDQEIQEHLWREHVVAQAEYEEEMQEVRDRADALIAQIDEEERQCREELERIKARPIVLRDGRVVEPDANGQFTTDANGRALTDTEKADAERQQQKKEADEQALADRMAQLEVAKAHAEKARDLASQSGANLTPTQMKQKVAEAQNETAMAQATAQKQTHYETSADVSSTLSSTDALAALGLGAPTADRTTSFSATLDTKDSRSTLVQSQFTGAAQGASAPTQDDPTPAGNQAPKTPIVQPNQ
jgi:hypothetical protein